MDMNLELVGWYGRPEKDSYYNHLQQASIPSMGTFYNGLRVPDILLTVLYRIDPKTKKMTHDVHLKFQTDGPSDAQLNFPHAYLEHSYGDKDKYTFSLTVDITFNSTTTLSRTIKGGGNVQLDGKIISGGVDGSYERGKQYADTVTSLRGRIEGALEPYTQHNRLNVSGHITGQAASHRDK